MEALRTLSLAIMSVIMLGACYFASVALGWFLALLGAIAIALTIAVGLLVFLYFILRWAWRKVSSRRQGS